MCPALWSWIVGAVEATGGDAENGSEERTPCVFQDLGANVTLF